MLATRKINVECVVVKSIKLMAIEIADIRSTSFTP